MMDKMKQGIDVEGMATSLDMATKDTASLKHYVEKAIPDSDGIKTFNDIPDQMPPILKKNCINRVLLFNGCFNPPHCGHLALLSHVFHNCGEDLNVIVAIVLVASDEYLNWKYVREPKRHRFSEKQRMQLWDGALEKVNWCLVYPEARFYDFSSELSQSLNQDGYSLEFIRLAGGDAVSISSQAHGRFGCRNLITSDICRRVDFFANGPASLKTLKNHGPWRKIQPDPSALQDRATESVSLSQRSQQSESRNHLPDIAGSEPPEIGFERSFDQEYSQSMSTGMSTASARQIWVCNCTNRRWDYTIRFISSDQHLDAAISSTNVRRILATTHIDQLEADLQGIALSPELLVQFLRDKVIADGQAIN
ncbi:hypothetical protein F5B20DRAFT_561467 [Whalleya microplaca]|nr:hypothetical protein F5B20DRAFT_561467 [Whalleya microplaca]